MEDTKMRGRRLFQGALVCLAGLLPFTCMAQSDSSLPHFGLGITVGTLGAGIQAATAVTHSSNVRAGFNYFTYSASLTGSNDNITFNGTLKLESAEVLFDQYIGHSFHISPGVVIYDGNQNAQGRVHTDGRGMALAEPAGGIGPGTPLAALEGIPTSDFLARVRRLAGGAPRTEEHTSELQSL